MKQTRAVVKQRVEEVLALRIAGAEFRDIRDYANSPNPEEGREPWNVSDSQIWRYIRAGDDLLAEQLDKDRERNLNRHIAQRRSLYARALAVSDCSTARQILKDEAELLNLYGPKKVEVGGPNGTPIQTINAHVSLTDDDRDRALHAILTRLGQGDDRPADSGATDANRLAVGEPGTADADGGDGAGRLAETPPPLHL